MEIKKVAQVDLGPDDWVAGGIWRGRLGVRDCRRQK